jgi:hypothetical protein
VENEKGPSKITLRTEDMRIYGREYYFGDLLARSARKFPDKTAPAEPPAAKVFRRKVLATLGDGKHGF